MGLEGGVTAYFLDNEPTSVGIFLSKPFWGGGKVKASVNSATKKENTDDPKPDELTMNRMSPDESREEVRTREPCNTLG